jgi:hypothetical protein
MSYINELYKMKYSPIIASKYLITLALPTGFEPVLQP